jgi:hypothetical protein
MAEMPVASVLVERSEQADPELLDRAYWSPPAQVRLLARERPSGAGMPSVLVRKIAFGADIHWKRQSSPPMEVASPRGAGTGRSRTGRCDVLSS